MHYSGLHYYEPTNKDLLFLNTVSKNKEPFNKRKIKSAVKACELQHALGLTTAKEVKWIIRSNHIQECPLDNKDVENAEFVLGKYMSYLKVKMTRKKPIRVTEDLIRVPKEFFKIQQMCIPNHGYIFCE